MWFKRTLPLHSRHVSAGLLFCVSVQALLCCLISIQPHQACALSKHFLRLPRYLCHLLPGTAMLVTRQIVTVLTATMLLLAVVLAQPTDRLL